MSDLTTFLSGRDQRLNDFWAKEYAEGKRLRAQELNVERDRLKAEVEQLEKKLESELANNSDPLVRYHFNRLKSDDAEIAGMSRVYMRNKAGEGTAYQVLVELEAKRFEWNEKFL